MIDIMSPEFRILFHGKLLMKTEKTGIRSWTVNCIRH